MTVVSHLRTLWASGLLPLALLPPFIGVTIGSIIADDSNAIAQKAVGVTINALIWALITVAIIVRRHYDAELERDEAEYRLRQERYDAVARQRNRGQVNQL